MKEGWKLEKLGDVLKVIRGSSPRPIKNFISENEDGVNWIKIGDVGENEKYVTSTRQKITAEGALRSRYVEIGDFIFSNSMSFGRAYIMKIDGYIHDGWFSFKLPDNIDHNFLWYLFRSPNLYEQIQKLASGAIVLNVSGDLIKKAILPIPPLHEQQAIVKKLDFAFDAIEKAKANIEKNIENAKELFQSKLHEIFSQKGERKTPWEEKKLGEVCIIKGGGTPSKANVDFYKGNIPWITVRDMKSDLINKIEFKINEDAVKKSSTNIIPKGNVIISTRVGLGRVGMIEIDSAINQDLKGLLPKNKSLLPKFIFWWYKSVSDLVINAGTGLTVQGVKLDFINKLKISIPNSIEEQQKIIFHVDKLFSQTNLLQEKYKQKLVNLEEMKKSILEKAFKGDLV